MNGYQIVSEALIFSQEDTVHNFDEWKKGVVKNLFVLGF